MKRSEAGVISIVVFFAILSIFTLMIGGLAFTNFHIERMAHQAQVDAVARTALLLVKRNGLGSECEGGIPHPLLERAWELNQWPVGEAVEGDEVPCPSVVEVNDDDLVEVTVSSTVPFQSVWGQIFAGPETLTSTGATEMNYQSELVFSGALPSVSIVADLSNSMLENGTGIESRQRQLNRALRRLLNGPGGTPLFVNFAGLAFSHQVPAQAGAQVAFSPQEVSEMRSPGGGIDTTGLSAQNARVQAALTGVSIQNNFGTCFSEALRQGRRSFADVSDVDADKVILFVTDGVPHSCVNASGQSVVEENSEPLDQANRNRNREITVHSVYIGPGEGQEVAPARPNLGLGAVSHADAIEYLRQIAGSDIALTPDTYPGVTHDASTGLPALLEFFAQLSPNLNCRAPLVFPAHPPLPGAIVDVGAVDGDAHDLLSMGEDDFVSVMITRDGEHVPLVYFDEAVTAYHAQHPNSGQPCLNGMSDDQCLVQIELQNSGGVETDVCSATGRLPVDGKGCCHPATIATADCDVLGAPAGIGGFFNIEHDGGQAFVVINDSACREWMEGETLSAFVGRSRVVQ